MDKLPSDLLDARLMYAFEGNVMPPDVGDLLKKAPLAGFTLFREYNVSDSAQLRALCIELNETAAAKQDLPLLLAMDQEGGQLIAMGSESTQFAGNMAIGAAQDAELARRIGHAIGLEMRATGININYAPICDLNTNPKNPSLGIRAFSDDAELAGEMAFAMVSGLQSAGVAATMKHFPGKGAAAVDSHYALPTLTHDRQRLEEVELHPFQRAIEAGVALVMTGHFALPAITGNNELPATLSKKVLVDLLRHEMGFDGVVITDALDMKALSQGSGQIVDVIAAIRAGVDLLLLTADKEAQDRARHGLKLAYTRELIDLSSLQASQDRITKLKTWLKEFEQPPLDVVGCQEHQALAQELAEKSITLVRNDAGLLPLELAEDARICVVFPEPKNLTPADTSDFVQIKLSDALRQHHAHVDKFVTAHPPEDNEISALKEKVAGYDLLVLGTISASMDIQQEEMAKELLKTNIPTITVALRTPYDLLAYPQAQTHVCTYSILETSMQALADALFGKIQFQGKLPVTIPEMYPSGHGLQC
ncbi:MAG: glycoside hydrolase family 3 protein [Chloroflexi bacterium]|nr:MAG: glycoside hydrolase family 3 protein [Chloroflexota bacterium]MBL1196727.1 glycoside hydrolase family 3 protein [Chloroflexota bacterium]NOH14020.1 glycoside hydrolase family 3 protein [Chloroflexota bacterium]